MQTFRRHKLSSDLVDHQAELQRGYGQYALAWLTFVLTLSYLDTSLMVILLEPIKRDLLLSDSQLGLLTGIAFALFYATLGLPIARWSDRGNRVTIAAISIGLWGATVMSSVFIGNFTQLVIVRIAAGIGQAGCWPPMYSLVGDYFPRKRELTRAMTLFMLSQPISALGYFGGGWLNERYGWRMTFFLIGLPGLVAAIITRLTIKETRRRPVIPDKEGNTLSMRAVIMTLWQQRSYRHLIVAMVLLFVVGQGLNPWYGAFLARSHGMESGELGLWLTIIFGVGLTVGTLLGGYVMDRWFLHNERGQMQLTSCSIALLVPFSFLFLLLPQKWEALMALVPITMAYGFFSGPTFALMQRLVKDEMRSTSVAVAMLLSNLVGMGAGPQAVGALSDLLHTSLGNDSLRYAMLAVSCITLWSAYHFWRVGRTVVEDLSSVDTPTMAGVI